MEVNERGWPKEPPVYIIRWDKPITWPDGVISNMCARGGTYEEVKQYANEMAEKHGLKVEVIV